MDKFVKKMDMKEKNLNQQPLSDDELVAMFFEENRQEVEDNGFSGQVMHSLPSQSMWIRRAWTLVCWVVGIAFFFFADGVGLLKRVLFNALGNFLGFASSIDFQGLSPLMIIAAIGLVMLFGAWNIAENLEQRDRLFYSKK